MNWVKKNIRFERFEKKKNHFSSSSSSDDLTKRLITSHPEQAEVIVEKQQVIQNQWTDLTSKADLHKVESIRKQRKRCFSRFF